MKNIRLLFAGIALLLPLNVYAVDVFDNIPAEKEAKQQEREPSSSSDIPSEVKGFIEEPLGEDISGLNTSEEGAEDPEKEAKKPKFYDGKIAILQVLDKMTTRKSTVKLQASESYDLDTVTIKLHRCIKNNGGTSRALVEVASINTIPTDISKIESAKAKRDRSKSRQDRKVIFLGWLFSDSISLVNVEHPVYDITLIGCTTK